MKVYHVSWDPIQKLSRQPMWFWMNKRLAIDLKSNIKEYDNVDAFLYEASVNGRIAKTSDTAIQNLFTEHGLDLFDYEAQLTENPEESEINGMPGTQVLIQSGFAGIIHYDYDPSDHGDAESLLIFEPQSSVTGFTEDGMVNELKHLRKFIKQILSE